VIDAETLWAALVRRHLGRRFGPVGPRLLHEPGSLRQVALWPYSQVMHARALLALTDVGGRPADRPRIPPMLGRYTQGAAFVARPSGGRIFWDDNGWVALAQAQDRAGRGHPPLSEAAVARGNRLVGAVPPDGGVEWFEGGGARHACATGAVGAALTLLVEQVVGAQAAAARCADFLETVLTDDDGIVQDHAAPDGVVDPTRWVYNQGLAVRLNVALAALGDPGAGDRAVAAAEAGQRCFTPDVLWAQPIAFVAVWFRGLVALAARSPEHVEPVRADLAAYAARLADTLSHEPGTLPTPLDGGPGRYERGESAVVDLAGAVQVLALAELPAERWRDVV
jgi:hypothetical protein